jgi:hypothetical protein
LSKREDNEELLKSLEGKFLWYVYRVKPRTELIFIEKYINTQYHNKVEFHVFNVTTNEKDIRSIGKTFTYQLAQTGETVFTPIDHVEKIYVL